MKTQGEIEAAICEGISRFEQEYMGRGPKDIRAHLIDDMLFVRLQGVLTAAEQHLVKSLPAEKGRDLLKQVRTHLLETARPLLESMVQEVTGIEVVSMHHDISTVTGEEVVLFTLAEAPRVRETKKKTSVLKREMRRDRQPFPSRPRRFRPAKPAGWVIRGAQILNRLDLAWRNRLRLEERDLEVLRALPRGAGIILASNHADETDMKACLELSRRCRRRFLYMANREAFDEGFGLAGWWLQRLGSFSVERGGHNEVAKRFAIDVVKRGQEVLVIFPEGEIYYLNDLVQPFKSGAVEIGMQAVVERRRQQPDWTAYLVPMAIKYRYRQPIRPVLDAKDTLDGAASLPATPSDSLPRRLALIVAELLHRQELIHHLAARPGSSRRADRSRAGGAAGGPLADRSRSTRARPPTHRAQTMDRTWRLSSYLRSC